MDRIRVTLDDGIVEGIAESDVHRFYSIPYAAPLTDERRFRRPQPVERWDGVRDATTPGPSAPQSQPEKMAAIDIERMFGTPQQSGPDYLTLNVFAPAKADAAPVMLFIHGGSFVSGSKDCPVYDGRAFARDGVVCVVINYRVGIEGFLPIAGADTNIGIRDMIAALAWVRDNIARFGGSATNVTVFGESGGAWCIAGLMVSPLAAGLFRRAICQSGHALLTRDRSVVQRLVERIAKRLGIKPDRESFVGLPAERMLPAQDWAMKPSIWFDMRDADRRDPSFGITRFLPVHGDDVFPVSAIEALRQGAGKDIDLLIGTTREEARLFFVPGNAIGKLKRWVALIFLRKALPNPRAALQAYGFDEPGAIPGEVLTRAMTDLMFRWMTRRTAELHRGRSHVYEFEWRSPAFDGQLGAAHAVELPFVFDTLSTADGPRGLLGENPPQALADSIRRLWIGFATNGVLPWAPYVAETRQVWSLTREVAEHEPVMPAAAFLP